MIGSNNIVNSSVDIQDLSNAIFKVAETIRLKHPNAFIISLVKRNYITHLD